MPQLHLNLWPVRSGPQLSTLSAATTTATLAKLFDLHVRQTEAVTYMHIGDRSTRPYWQQLCHRLTLEARLRELPRLDAHPALPHVLRPPQRLGILGNLCPC